MEQMYIEQCKDVCITINDALAIVDKQINTEQTYGDSVKKIEDFDADNTSASRQALFEISTVQSCSEIDNKVLVVEILRCVCDSCGFLLEDDTKSLILNEINSDEQSVMIKSFSILEVIVFTVKINSYL